MLLQLFMPGLPVGCCFRVNGNVDNSTFEKVEFILSKKVNIHLFNLTFKALEFLLKNVYLFFIVDY